MKTNPGVIVDCDQPADDKRLRSVLHDWGYSEKEIQQFLSERVRKTRSSLASSHGARGEG